MKNRILLFIGFVILISSCKKKDEETDPHAGSLITHYSYVKGIVVDSIAGMPLPNSRVYCSSSAFTYGDSYFPDDDSTDVNGAYTVRIEWRTGYSYSAGYLYKPSDSTDFYINSYSTNLCNFLKIKWWQLVENDTITLPTISSKPYSYVSTHIKDTLPSSSGIGVTWNPTIIGPTAVSYPSNTDIIVVRKICPELKVYINSDSVFVNSGDTAFVNVFY